MLFYEHVTQNKKCAHIRLMSLSWLFFLLDEMTVFEQWHNIMYKMVKRHRPFSNHKTSSLPRRTQYINNFIISKTYGMWWVEFNSFQNAINSCIRRKYLRPIFISDSKWIRNIYSYIFVYMLIVGQYAIKMPCAKIEKKEKKTNPSPHLRLYIYTIPTFFLHRGNTSLENVDVCSLLRC